MALAPFAAAFLACYPITHEYFSVRTAVSQWLALSAVCPRQTRAEFQLFLVRKYVPSHWYDETLHETRRVLFLPEAEARIREMILAEAIPTSQYVPPDAHADAGDDAPVESAATRRARRARGSKKTSFRWRRRDSGGLPIMLVVVGLVVIAILVAAIVYLVNR
jgi:hypothetical protein